MNSEKREGQIKRDFFKKHFNSLTQLCMSCPALCYHFYTKISVYLQVNPAIECFPMPAMHLPFVSVLSIMSCSMSQCSRKQGMVECSMEASDNLTGFALLHLLLQIFFKINTSWTMIDGWLNGDGWKTNYTTLSRTSTLSFILFIYLRWWKNPEKFHISWKVWKIDMEGNPMITWMSCLTFKCSFYFDICWRSQRDLERILRGIEKKNIDVPCHSIMKDKYSQLLGRSWHPDSALFVEVVKRNWLWLLVFCSWQFWGNHTMWNQIHESCTYWVFFV